MQRSLASKDNKIQVQEVETPPPYFDEAYTKMLRWTKNSDLDVSNFKGWKKKFGTKNESLHENDEETRRGRRFRASYESFEEISLKTACIKLWRRIKNGLFSSWVTHATMENEGCEFEFWRNKEIRLKDWSKWNMVRLNVDKIKLTTWMAIW